MSRARDTHTRSDTDDELVKAHVPLSVDDRRQRLVSIFDRDRHFPADGVTQQVASDGPTGDQCGQVRNDLRGRHFTGWNCSTPGSRACGKTRSTPPRFTSNALACRAVCMRVATSSPSIMTLARVGLNKSGPHAHPGRTAEAATPPIVRPMTLMIVARLGFGAS